MFHDIKTVEDSMAMEQTFMSAFKDLEDEGKVCLIMCRCNLPPCSVSLCAKNLMKCYETRKQVQEVQQDSKTDCLVF